MSSPADENSAAKTQEKRLIPRLDNERWFWWLNEYFDTPSERAARRKLIDANKKKWGKILSNADTFDDSDYQPDQPDQPDARTKLAGGVPPDVFLVAASTLLVLGLALVASWR